MKSRLLKAILFGVAVGIVGLILSYLNPMFSLEGNSGLGPLFKLSIYEESSNRVDIPDSLSIYPRRNASDNR